MENTPTDQRWNTVTLKRSESGGAGLWVQGNESGIEESMTNRFFLMA